LSFPKAERFKDFRKFDIYNMQPGPGDYDPSGKTKQTFLLQTINADLSLKLKRKSTNNYTSPKRVNPRSTHKSIYFPEYRKEFYNVEGPGPGRYPFEKFVKSINSRAGQRFSKADRNLNRSELQATDTPLSYVEGESSMVLLQKQNFNASSQTFSRASRNLVDKSSHTLVY
jgi:hypothetical protein